MKRVKEKKKEQFKSNRVSVQSNRQSYGKTGKNDEMKNRF